MKLSHLEIESVRGAPDGKYDFGHPLTLVTGKASAGKTSLLHAIALAKDSVGAYGGNTVMPSHLLRRGADTVAMEARWRLDDTEREELQALCLELDGESDVAVPEEITTSVVNDGDSLHTQAEGPFARPLAKLFGRYDARPERAKMELFNARRHMRPDLWREHPGDLDAIREAALRLSVDPSKYGFVRAWCFELVVAEGMRMQEILASEGMLVPSEDLDLLAPFKRTLATLSNSIRLQHVEARKAGGTLVWFARRDGSRVELADLSESESQAVIFASTFLRQGLHNSIVLIDRPELFIEEGNELAFLTSLTKLGDDNQVVAATSSSILAKDAEAHVIALSGEAGSA